MKYLITTIAAVLLVGCGGSQESVPQAESEPVESVAEVPAKPSNSEADRALLKAAKDGNVEAVKQHLAAGADVNAKIEGYAGTPLHYAAGEGHKEIAELLITNGADVDWQDEDGETPLDVAARFGHKKIAELFITKGADVNGKRDDEWATPLDWAILKDHTEIAALLRKHGGKHGSIRSAAYVGNIEAVKGFLAVGTDVNAKGVSGLTPLHRAVTLGHKEIAELLIAKGADVNAKEDDGHTPLDGAFGETADLLRKHGGKTGEELKAEGK